MMRREERQKHLSPSREQNHQPRGPNKGLVLRDHNREDHKNRVRVPLDRGQSQGKVRLGRDPGKVRDHQDRGLNKARAPLAKDLQGNRHQNQVQDHRVKAPNRVALPNKKVHHHHHRDPGSLDPSSKGHRGPRHSRGSRQRKGPLRSLQVGSVLCAKPRKSTSGQRIHQTTAAARSVRSKCAASVGSAHRTQR